MGVFAAIAALIAITVLVARTIEGIRERSDWVEHTHAVRSEIAGLHARYESARFHWRYHFIAGAAESLSQYRHAANLLDQHVAALRPMLVDNPAQTQRLDRLERLLVDERKMLDELADRKAAGEYGRSDEMLEALERTQHAVASTSMLFAEMLGAENQLLAARQGAAERSERAIKWIVLGGSAAAIAMLAAAFLLLRREILKHRRTQAEAGRITAELEDLYNKAPCGYHSVDENGLIVRMNDTWLGWLGYSRDEVVGRLHHADLMTPGSAQRFREHWFPLFRKQGWLKEVEFEYVRKDGTTFPGSLQTSTIYGADGRYVMSRTTVFDISERRRMVDALKDSNAFLDSVVENIPNMIFVKDAGELRFVRFNRAGEDLLGYARAQLIGKNDYDFFPPAEADFFTAKDREVLRSGALVEIEAEEIETRLKGRRILHTKKLPIMDSAGAAPKYLLGISEDITERRRTEEAIKALNADLAGAHARDKRALARHAERLRILHEIDRAVVAEMSPEAIAAAVIQPLRELLGTPRVIVNKFDLQAGEVEWIAAAGRRRMHVGPGVRYSIRLMGDVEALRRGEPQTIDVQALPPGPEAAALLASGVRTYTAVPMIAGGELLGALSFGSETSEIPEEQANIAQEVAMQLAIALAQARLLERVRGHAAELEARVTERTHELEVANKELESFSYSVSHDLRAPLRAVDGYARMLEEDYAPRLDDEGRRLLGVVRDASHRMGELIDDLLAFSRLGRQELAKRTLDMTALAREVLAKLAGESRAAVDLAALPAAEADRALLRQVWLNLIGNALKYSGTREMARIEIGGSEAPGENLYWVRDNGVGFDMRYAGKLFGVFQRLHPADEFPGTGVGLAIVQRVIARHGGRVWAEGRTGEGATFHFSLPQGS